MPFNKLNKIIRHCLPQWLRTHAASFSLILEIKHVFNSSNWALEVIQLHLAKSWWHWTVFFDPRPDFAIPRTSSKAVLRRQNAGPKMRPFSEPTAIVPIREGTRNGSEFRAHFWPRSSPFLNALFEFSIRKKWLQTAVAVEPAIFHNLSLFCAANVTA